jgi:predicted Ser/Thr protein kinase
MTADRSMLDPEMFEDGPLCPRGCGVPTHRVHRIYRNHQTGPYHDCPRRAEPELSGTAIAATDDILRERMRNIAPPWLRPQFTHEHVEDLVRHALRRLDYNDASIAHIVLGEVAQGHVRAHVQALVSKTALRRVEEIASDDLPAWFILTVSAMGYCEKHEDCLEHDDLAAECWRSTH